ncbi:MAG: hypothetical protein K2O44_06830 [Clostridia bacterium]|nr:hypothetical protein [Clostridia bacterium]
MKRFSKIIACLLICFGCACVGMFGCSGNNQPDYSEKIAELEQQIKDLQSNQNTDYSDEIAALQQKISELEAQNKNKIDKIDELEQTLKDLEIRELNSNYNFFTDQANIFTYSDFDYSMEDETLSYEIGTTENEELYQRILSGELNYVDYLGWFAYYPDYIIRYNMDALTCIEAVIREGEFTEQLRAKYFSFYGAGSTHPCLATAGMSSLVYNITFTDDWKVENVRAGRNDYKPFIDNDGNLKYYLSFNQLLLNVDMGDGRTASCIVHATYYPVPKTKTVWNGEKQEHESVTYLSECTIAADSNNVYSQGEHLFDDIYLYTEIEGIWDLEQVWKAFKKQATTPSLNLYPGMTEHKIRFLK